LCAAALHVRTTADRQIATGFFLIDAFLPDQRCEISEFSAGRLICVIVGAACSGKIVPNCRGALWLCQRSPGAWQAAYRGLLGKMAKKRVCNGLAAGVGVFSAADCEVYSDAGRPMRRFAGPVGLPGRDFIGLEIERVAGQPR
jgi:hypothetical protein